MDWIKNLVGQEDDGYSWNYDDEGINFILTSKQLRELKEGEADQLLVCQQVALQMLIEQGSAELLPNGVLVPSDTVVLLDDSSRLLLDLPNQWDGLLKTDIQGSTGSTSFKVVLTVADGNGKFTHGFTVEGPIIKFSSTQQYLLTPPQHLIFNAHSAHALSEKSEYDNLKLLLALQKSQGMGAKISLTHFEKLNIRAPESISVEAELDNEGRLILTPNMGQEASHERMQQVLGQLHSEAATSLRIDDEIILFDEQKLKAIREVLRNRIVNKSKVQDFLKNPTAFINAELVNLDIGFSVRVKGATRFRHAYFGETDESGIDWFGAKFATSEVYPASKLKKIIMDEDMLGAFKKEFEAAVTTGAGEVEFEGKIYDISDKQSVEEILSSLERAIAQGGVESDEELDRSEERDDNEKEDRELIVVDIALNDDDLASPSLSLDKAISEVLLPETNLDWNNYARHPYPHQIVGTRWILGLALESKTIGGGLLADDMGLGKTFMALAAMDHLYKHCKYNEKTEKPCLVVAPLSLLENWKDEVEVTFNSSPFKDIILLQADGELSRFRLGGPEINNQLFDDEESEIRYSLKIGPTVSDRLDMPNRLVITTYQTLRDYQFSLCTIDWGMVVFDEAQNIKNPNALQSRAAKGLKADFRLIATGTPVENSLADFWCLMDTACPGYLNSYQEFRQEYITPILRAAGDEIEHVRGTIGRRLRERVGALMLRRVKEDNLEGLPNKTVFVGTEDETWEYLPILSSTMRSGQLDSYDEVLKNTAEAEQNIVLASLQKLRDISLHPRLVYGGRLDVPKKKNDLNSLMQESGKFSSLLTVLDEIKAKNEKCIIFTINKKLQAFLAVALSSLYKMPAVFIINGDAKAVAKRSSTPTRKSMIAEFESKDGFNIIIMSPVAAGVGLTVVGANNVIHLERHWNPAKEAQATDRVYRIGQHRAVNVFIPLLHHPKHQSFDVNLHQLLSKKSLLKDSVVTPEQVIPKLDGIDQKTWSPERQITSENLRELSWQQFEALCAEILQKEYSASSCWLTRNSADFGADVVLVLEGSGVLVQCKHTTGNLYDGYHAIQEVHSARVRYEAELNKSFDRLVFITNAARLSRQLRNLAKQYSVEVIDGNLLTDLLRKHRISYQAVLSRLNKDRISV